MTENEAVELWIAEIAEMALNWDAKYGPLNSSIIGQTLDLNDEGLRKVRARIEALYKLRRA